ncbi:MAG: hypothetical protein Q9225_001844 [Loekoesia sp. 1 TL-2023]
MIPVVEISEPSIIVAPAHAETSKRKWQRSADGEEPFDRDTVGSQGLLKKTPTGVVNLEKIITVVPLLSGTRRGDPFSTPGVIILADARDEGSLRTRIG